MSIKEQIVAALMDEGYGFMGAAAEATEVLAEINQRPPGTYTYNSERHSFKIVRGGG